MESSYDLERESLVIGLPLCKIVRINIRYRVAGISFYICYNMLLWQRIYVHICVIK